jgi:hypothetical protein
MGPFAREALEMREASEAREARYFFAFGSQFFSEAVFFVFAFLASEP